MRINMYRKEDFDAIIVINNACYSGEFQAPADKMRDMISVSDVWVARTDTGEIIGFAIVRCVDQPYLWNIAVAPAYQKRGIAGNLLREIIKTYTLSKEPFITLHVNVNNDTAKRLYENYGFKVIDLAENYYASDDGYLMKRYLP